MADRASARTKWCRPGLTAHRGDRGAALVEFVLILPVFMLLVLGVLTGGLAYARKSSVTQASREGARYGATLPMAGAYGTPNAWLDEVARVVEATGDGELSPSVASRYICVAWVPASGTPRRAVLSGASPAATYSNGTCSNDGRTETRVQVVASRQSRFDALVFSTDLDLESKTTARFEASP